MPKFELACVIGVSGYTVVKARTLEDAIKKAKARDVRFSISGDADPHECWVVDYADGEPDDIVPSNAELTGASRNGEASE